MKYVLAIMAVLLLAVLGAGYWMVARTDALERCMEFPPGPRTACFQEIIDEVAGDGDYTEAFALVSRAYDLDADFAGNCHGSVHEIGKIAYERFRENEDSSFTAQAHVCGYGFYHGFMEQLLVESGAIDEAQAFCDALGEQLFEETVDARGACYHGIGHGTVDGTDPRLWGDARALVAGGLTMCELVAESLPDNADGTGPLYRCATGAYNSLEILSQDEKYGLAALAANPFGFCQSEPTRYQHGCFTNMIPAVMRLRDDDFSLVVADIESIPGLRDEERAILVMDLSHEFIRLHLAESASTVEDAVSLCRSFRNPLRLGCIEGLSGGHLKYGPPGRESENLVLFCSSESLLTDERNACWRHSLSRLRNMYSSEKVQAICAGVPEDARRFCSDS